MPKVKFDTDGILEPVKGSDKGATEEQSNPSMRERAWGLLSSRNVSYVTGGIMTATVLGLAPFAATSAAAGIAALSIGTVGTIAGYMVNNVASARKSRRDTLEQFRVMSEKHINSVNDIDEQAAIDRNYKSKGEALVAYANTHYALNVATNTLASVGVTVGTVLLGVEQFSGAAELGVQSFAGAAVACASLATSVAVQAFTNGRFNKVRNNYQQREAELAESINDIEAGLTHLVSNENNLTESQTSRRSCGQESEQDSIEMVHFNNNELERHEQRMRAEDAAIIVDDEEQRGEASTTLVNDINAEQKTQSVETRAGLAEQRAIEAERNEQMARDFAHEAQKQAKAAEEEAARLKAELKSAQARIEQLDPLLEKLDEKAAQIAQRFNVDTDKPHAEASSTSSAFPKSRPALAPGKRIISAVQPTTIPEEKVESDKSNARRNSF